MLDPTTHALIFDMDGVIVDNTAVQARAFQLLFRDLGLTTNARRLLERLNGMPAGAIIQSVFRHPIPKKQLQTYTDQRELLYRVLYWQKRREALGLRAFLQAARTAGFRIGLGTGSGNDTIGYIIDYLHLRSSFDVVITKDDVSRGKPHADTYSVTANKLGVAPENCVVFEDALIGEQAAYKAGMRCIGLSTTLSAEQFQAPLKVIKDFTEITPNDILQLLEENPAIPKPSKKFEAARYTQQP